jgi:hypothetical protein
MTKLNEAAYERSLCQALVDFLVPTRRVGTL